MSRVSLSRLLVGHDQAVCTAVNLDPEDDRTRAFKRAATSLISECRKNPKIQTLGFNRGSVKINWDDPYSEDLPAELADQLPEQIAKATSLAGDVSTATMHAIHRYVKPVLGKQSEPETDEWIRQLVCGVAKCYE